jgi:hypothetical protein
VASLKRIDAVASLIIGGGMALSRRSTDWR